MSGRPFAAISTFRRWCIVAAAFAAWIVSGHSGAASELDTADETTPKPRTVKVAGIMFEHATGGNYKDANLVAAETLIREAASAGAQIVCTCEQFLDGYGRDANKMQGAEDEQADRCEVIATSPYVKRLSELAGELHIVVVAGLAIREGQRTYNSALVFGADGKLVGIYRKTHNAGKYARWFAPLSDQEKKAACSSFDVGPGKLSVKICNDRHFSETTTYMVDSGCELLLCPAFGNYDPSKLRDDSEKFGLWAVFVHPDGCQFIDRGRIVLEQQRGPDESLFTLHEIEFRSAHSSSKDGREL